MDHVAIMKKSWGLIPKILSGKKTIESRWYQTRRAPWGKATIGDTIFFKNSGELVTAQATISRVMQFELAGLSDMARIIDKYGEKIGLVNKNPATWGKTPKYCVLLWLKDPKSIKKPFGIRKAGFGSAAAWLTLKNINKIRSGPSAV